MRLSACGSPTGHRRFSIWISLSCPTGLLTLPSKGHTIGFRKPPKLKSTSSTLRPPGRARFTPWRKTSRRKPPPKKDGCYQPAAATKGKCFSYRFIERFAERRLKQTLVGPRPPRIAPRTGFGGVLHSCLWGGGLPPPRYFH